MMEMFKEMIQNKWFLSAVACVVTLLLLIDWKKFYLNAWGGVIASGIQLLHDTLADKRDFYHVHDAGIWILRSSAFFTFGIVFPMGVLFLQYLPSNPKLQLAHLLFFSSGFLFFEWVVVHYDLLDHVIWSYWGSFWDNILVMATLAWSKPLIIYISGLRRR